MLHKQTNPVNNEIEYYVHYTECTCSPRPLVPARSPCQHESRPRVCVKPGNAGHSGAAAPSACARAAANDAVVPVLNAAGGADNKRLDEWVSSERLDFANVASKGEDKDGAVRSARWPAVPHARGCLGLHPAAPSSLALTASPSSPPCSVGDGQEEAQAQVRHQG